MGYGEAKKQYTKHQVSQVWGGGDPRRKSAGYARNRGGIQVERERSSTGGQKGRNSSTCTDLGKHKKGVREENR